MQVMKNYGPSRVSHPYAGLREQRNKSQFHRRICFSFAAAIVAVALTLATTPNRSEAAATFSAVPSSEAFGTVSIGTRSTKTIQLKNALGKSVVISSIAATGNGFSVSGFNLPMTLQSGSSVQFTVAFLPTAAGSVSGTMTVTESGGTKLVSVPLSGTGAGSSPSPGTGEALDVTPTTAAFGNVPIGTRNTRVVQLKNELSENVTIASITATGTGFSVSGFNLPMTLHSGSSVQFTVAFLPTAAGSVNGTMTVTESGGAKAATVALSGTGAGSSRVLDLSPSSVSFGDINVNSSSTADVTLTNGGNSNLSISGVSISGTGLSDTGVSAGTTLEPGQSATIKTQFAPKSTGSVSGAITIASNATNGTSIQVPVSGTGVSASSSSQHVVDLSWEASTSSGVTGYNVYRGTTSGGPYSKLNSSPVSGTSYSDSSVSSATYYYVLTTVASSGATSGYSNQATVTVP